MGRRIRDGVILAYVARHPECTNKAVAGHVGITQKQIILRLKALEKRGLLVRRRRGKFMGNSLSRKGYAFLEHPPKEPARFKNSVLHPEHEKRILAYIQSHPGSTSKDLRRALEISAEAVSGHVLALQRQGLIVKRSVKKSRHLYAPDAAPSPQKAEVEVWRNKPEMQKLLAFIAKKPAQSRAAIARHAAKTWKWPAGTTILRLSRLRKLGLTSSGPQRSRTAYTVVPA